jgi:hypothetical protein
MKRPKKISFSRVSLEVSNTLGLKITLAYQSVLAFLLVAF